MAGITNHDRHPRRIALVDCNNFYASCERVFQPQWNSRPVGVLSNNDGCIIARSDELKNAGIPMGAPFFKFRDQLNAMHAVVVSSNYTLYGDMSARVMHTLGRFTPAMEVYSIDEAWLDLTGFQAHTLDDYAREIVNTTRQHTGIPVSMGIGATKTLAKVANRICKKRCVPGNVFNLGGADNLQEILTAFPVGDVWGIGRRWAEKLNSHGIYTAWDLRQADPQHMRARYNVVMQRLIMELRGVSCLEEDDIEPKKQIIASRSFSQRVTDKNSLLESVSLHASRAGEKLRLQNSACGVLQVSIRTGRHNEREPYYANSTLIQFPVATSDTRKLIGAARAGIERIYKEGYRYAKAGVMAFNIVPADNIQQTLFCHGDDDKALSLMSCIDHINRRYGKHTVIFAASGIKQPWNMKRDRMTPAYTTRWADIPRVF